MKILFDYKIFYQQEYGGISNYFFNLGKQLLNLNIDIKFNCLMYRTKHLTNLPENNFKGFNVSFIPGKLNPLLEKINKKYFEKTYSKSNFSIIHETYYSKHTFGNVKKILTVYDMINELYPQSNNNSKEISNIKKESINRSDHIICISESCKNDLIKLFKIDPSKITVTHLASDIRVENVLLKNKKYKDFILYVGSRRGYKNFSSLIEVFSKSHYLKNNFKIAVYGGEKFGNKDIDILKKFNFPRDNIWIVNSKKFSLKDMYSNVSLFVYPSMYEGFGLPLVEAMSCGCPIVCSNVGSLEEVGGEGLKYFDINDNSHMSYVIENILKSKEAQEQLIDYGYNRSKKFSWKKCASETLNTYKNLIISK